MVSGKRNTRREMRYSISHQKNVGGTGFCLYFFQEFTIHYSPLTILEMDHVTRLEMGHVTRQGWDKP
jgi:hypothetical protein